MPHIWGIMLFIIIEQALLWKVKCVINKIWRERKYLIFEMVLIFLNTPNVLFLKLKSKFFCKKKLLEYGGSEKQSGVEALK